MDEFNQIKTLVAAAEVDILKAVAGNKAAAVRARKTLQVIKGACQDARNALMVQKPAAPASTAG